jgi:hypothetical protein
MLGGKLCGCLVYDERVESQIIQDRFLLRLACFRLPCVGSVVVERLSTSINVVTGDGFWEDAFRAPLASACCTCPEFPTLERVRSTAVLAFGVPEIRSGRLLKSGVCSARSAKQ